jgi:hypothetical protein
MMVLPHLGRADPSTRIRSSEFLHPSRGPHPQIIQEHVSGSRILLAPACDLRGPLHLCRHYILQSRHRIHCHPGEPPIDSNMHLDMIEAMPWHEDLQRNCVCLL